MTGLESSDQEHSLRERLERWRILGFGLIALVLYIIMSIVFPVPSPLEPGRAVDWPVAGKPSGTLLEVRTAIGAALISFFGFSAVLQLFQATSLTREIEATVTRVLAGNTLILDKFLRAVKRGFVRSSLESALGRAIGAASFAHVSTMMNESAVFRRRFEYRVWFKRALPEPLAGTAWETMFDPGTYLWVNENLAYQRYRPLDDSYERGPFEVAVTFDSATLSSLFSDQTLFARFLIQLEPRHMAQLADGGNLVDFVRKVCAFGVSTEPDDTVLKPDQLVCEYVQCPGGGGQGYVRVRIPVSLVADDAARLRLRVRYPYRRTARHFTFSMPQPVESPYLELNAAPCMTQIAAVPYLGVAPGKFTLRCISDGEIPSYQLSVDEGVWVFPTSGVTFVWSEAAEPAAATP